MSDVLVILADDLTGATDAAVAFAKRGARTDVWLDRPRALSDVDVAAIDLDTRALPPVAAADRVRTLLSALPPGVRLAKKIDSTLRGNIAAETDALLAGREGAVAIVVPAHPHNGRVQRDGILLVDGLPVHESDFGRDLFTPVGSSDVRRHLPEGRTALISAPGMLGGRAALARELTAAVGGGARAVTIDAQTEDDLTAIAALVAEDGRYICVGSAGLLEAFAPCVLGGVAAARGNPAPARGSVRHPVLFVIGSLSSMTHSQIARFSDCGGTTEMIDPRTILIDEGRARSQAIAARIDAALGADEDVLVALSSDRSDVEAALSMGRLHGFDVPTTSRALRERFVELVAPLLAKAGTVVLSGADVARTFLARAGIEGVRIIGEATANIPLARAIGSDVLVVTKAGGSGTPQTYLDIARGAVSGTRGSGLTRPNARFGSP